MVSLSPIQILIYVISITNLHHAPSYTTLHPTPRSILHHAPSYTTLHPPPRSILHHAQSYTTLHPTPRSILHHAISYTTLHPTSCIRSYILHPPRTGCSLRLIWHRTSDFHSKQICRAIPDYFGANQWCRTSVSGNDNHSLLITSKESQFAIQFFHYRLPFCPVQLCDVSRVNIVAKSNKYPF